MQRARHFTILYVIFIGEREIPKNLFFNEILANIKAKLLQFSQMYTYLFPLFLSSMFLLNGIFCETHIYFDLHVSAILSDEATVLPYILFELCVRARTYIRIYIYTIYTYIHIYDMTSNENQDLLRQTFTCYVTHT